MIEALQEIRTQLLNVTNNVKFAETVSDLTGETLPLVTIEIAKNIVNIAQNSKSVYLFITVYQDSLEEVLTIGNNIESTIKTTTWTNSVYVQLFRGIDTGQDNIKGKRMIFGVMMVEVVLRG